MAQKHLQTSLPDLTAFREMAATDSQYSDLMAYLLNKQLPEDTAHAARVARVGKQLKLCDGLLIRRIAQQGVSREQLFVPTDLRPTYLAAFHDQQGHPGRERTYSHLIRQVYWPGMWEDVTDHINACHECAFSKRSARPEGRGHIPTVGD